MQSLRGRVRASERERKSPHVQRLNTLEAECKQSFDGNEGKAKRDREMYVGRKGREQSCAVRTMCPPKCTRRIAGCTYTCSSFNVESRMLTTTAMNADATTDAMIDAFTPELLFWKSFSEPWMAPIATATTTAARANT